MKMTDTVGDLLEHLNTMPSEDIRITTSKGGVDTTYHAKATAAVIAADSKTAKIFAYHEEITKNV